MADRGQWGKRLIVAEVLICFAPLLLVLLIGLAILASQIAMLLLYGANTLPFIFMVVGGFIGMGGAWMLISTHFRSDPYPPSRRTIIVCLVVGFIAFGSYAVVGIFPDPSTLELLVFGLHLACTLHVLYITRAVLLRDDSAGGSQ